MSIQKISKEQLRRMGNQEGLILQGCGGDPQEWLDGINQILTDEGILKKGAGFEEAYTFQHDGLTCLLFPFKENMELDMGKLAVWRLATHSTFGGTWLSDYVPNRLGGFVQIQEQKEPDCVKPDCPLIGTDGNIFHLMGIASETLRKNGMQEQAEEMRNRIFQCQSYDSALSIIGDYVNINFILPETGKPCLLFYALFNLRNLLYIIKNDDKSIYFLSPHSKKILECGDFLFVEIALKLWSKKFFQKIFSKHPHKTLFFPR